MKRRQAVKLLGLGALSVPGKSSEMRMKSLLKRRIGETNEFLPVVGLGTWQTFDVGSTVKERLPLKQVLANFSAAGASVVDSSPMYGYSEQVVGELSTDLQINSKLFMATKVWTSGREAGLQQINNSLKLLNRKTIDLMQIHNLVDWQTHLATLQALKNDGKIRYIGLTHYTDSSHETLQSIIEKYPIDFLQINYSLDSRHAEVRLLPAARDKGVAVLINRPFNEGALFRLVRGKSIPAWGEEFDCTSWGCFFLKFILANPAVTCVIPGTANPNHLADNLSAGEGKLPNYEHLKKMIAFINE